MSASRPIPQVLAGRFVRLEPLLDNHLVELHAAIGHPEVYVLVLPAFAIAYPFGLVGVILEARKSEIRPKNLKLAAFLLASLVEAVTHGAVLMHPEYLVDLELVDETTEVICRPWCRPFQRQPNRSWPRRATRRASRG